MDLIHPHNKNDLALEVAEAAADGRRLLVVGGRRHMDRGNPVEADVELWTTQLHRLVAYEPAEMIAVVEAGMRCGELAGILADGGQEWPVDAPADATLGGVIATGVSSPRRLRVGAVRDTVLEVEVVTGDGRLVRGGGRTVKNVTGYDLPRLMTGSLGTLGVIVQVALKLRPMPAARRTVRAPGSLQAGARFLEAVPLPAGVLALPDHVELRLEGWPEAVEELTGLALETAEALEILDDAEFPASRPWDQYPIVAEAAVPPSRLPDLARAAGGAWGALLGVGILWAGFESADGELLRLRRKAEELGGSAQVIRGDGGLGDIELPALAIHRRLKRSFDPAGVLAPGRLGAIEP